MFYKKYIHIRVVKRCRKRLTYLTAEGCVLFFVIRFFFINYLRKEAVNENRFLLSEAVDAENRLSV